MTRAGVRTTLVRAGVLVTLVRTALAGAAFFFTSADASELPASARPATTAPHKAAVFHISRSRYRSRGARPMGVLLHPRPVAVPGRFDKQQATRRVGGVSLWRRPDQLG